MASTNMDTNKNKDVTAPVFEFSLPKSEIDAQVTVGEFGKVVIPVEIVAIEGDTVTFRKNGSASADGMFRPEPLNNMRERMGVTDDPEMSMSDEDED